MWSAKLQQIQVKALTKKSKANQTIVEWTTQLMQAEKEENADTKISILIKKFLERYLYWCMLRYSIAFFQWRRKFKTKQVDDDNNQAN